MVPRKKGQKYEISYRCAGYEKPFYERFDTYEAAKLRIAQIEYEKSICAFEPPKQSILTPKRNHYVTIGELLDEYVQIYGLKRLFIYQSALYSPLHQTGYRRCPCKRYDNARSGSVL